MKSILIIEDDDSIRHTLREVLELEDFQVFSAENGSVGISTLEGQTPSIIIIDLYMPVMDGKTFLKEFKTKFPGLKDVPILIMTAASPGDYPPDFEPSLILKKPLDLEEMLRKINQNI